MMMEFTIDRDAFSRALARVQGIVDNKSTMALLANVLIRTDDYNSITVAATDLDVTLVGQYPASVEQVGALTVGAKVLYDIVRRLPPGELAVRAMENNWVEILHGNIEFKLAGMPPEEFPALPEPVDALAMATNKKLLLSMIEAVIFSVSTDSARPNLCGVHVQAAGPERLAMVSTDGHRLSKIVRTVGTSTVNLPAEGVIVPRKGLAELKRALDSSEEMISFEVQGSMAIFRNGTDTLYVRLIEGEFPDIMKVLPKKGEARSVARMERDLLMVALDRISLFSQAKTHGVRVEFCTEGKIRIVASNPDLGRAQEDFEIDYDGEATEEGFNAQYLLDCLKQIQSREIMVDMAPDGLGPCVIRTEGDDDSFYVVMPMRL